MMTIMMEILVTSIYEDMNEECNKKIGLYNEANVGLFNEDRASSFSSDRNQRDWTS